MLNRLGVETVDVAVLVGAAVLVDGEDVVAVTAGDGVWVATSLVGVAVVVCATG